MFHLLSVLLVASFLWACNSSEGGDNTPAATVEALETIPVKADDIAVLLEERRGERAVIMNIWATWCIPCVEEFPYLVRVQNEFEDNLDVIFISADFPEALDRVHQFLSDQNVDWQTYFKDDRDEPFIDAVWSDWTGALPATVVYDTNGNMIAAFERPATYEEFRDLAINATQ